MCFGTVLLERFKDCRDQFYASLFTLGPDSTTEGSQDGQEVESHTLLLLLFSPVRPISENHEQSMSMMEHVGNSGNAEEEEEATRVF